MKWDERGENNKMGRTNSFKTVAWFESNDCDLDKRGTIRENRAYMGMDRKVHITILGANAKNSTFTGVKPLMHIKEFPWPLSALKHILRLTKTSGEIHNGFVGTLNVSL